MLTIKKFSIFLRRDSIVGTRVSTDGRGVVLNFTVGRSNFTKIIFEISLVYDHLEALLFIIIYILSYAYNRTLCSDSFYKKNDDTKALI